MEGSVTTPPDVRPERFLELTGTLLAVASFDGTVRWTSSSLPPELGFEPEEIVGRPFLEFMHPDDHERAAAAFVRLTHGERLQGFEVRVRARDGSYRSTLWSAGGVVEEGLVYAWAQDVTQLRAVEQRFESAFENAALATLLASARAEDVGRITEVNPAACRFTGRSGEELLATTVQALIHPDDVEPVLAEGRRVLAGAIAAYTLEVRYVRPDGDVCWGKQSVSLIRDAAGEPSLWVVQIEDVSERRHIEEVVRRSRERLQAIVDGMPSFAAVIDLEGRFETVNQRIAGVLGRHPKELVGRTPRELFDPAQVEPFERLLSRAARSAEPVTEEIMLTVAGERRTYLTHAFGLRDERGAVYALATTATDITARVRADEDRRRLEVRAQQAQRLESIGRLAGGIAHDFNNLLSVILNNASLAADDLPEGTQGGRDLAEVVAAAERAAELTHQLVLFSRQQVAESEIVEPNRVVERVERLLRRTIGEDIELRLDLGGDVPPVEIDGGQLDRVILNLAFNARDAMPGGGRLEICTDGVELDGRPHARLVVGDTGTGMSEEVVERAFEPFFTTKSSTGGTGLGLATVYGIVTQVGGQVELSSTPGEGTVVAVTLPAAGSRPAPPADGEAVGGRGRGETVLVAEDDEAVRRLAARLLEEAGYRVIEATDLAQALDACAEGSRRIDLLLADVVLPDGSGRVLADRLAQLQPDMTVLYMSGYSDDELRRHGVKRDEVAFLAKPFTRETLLGAVARGLAESTAAQG